MKVSICYEYLVPTHMCENKCTLELKPNYDFTEMFRISPEPS